MFKVTCADMGASCRWEATAETVEELRRLVREHTLKSHKQMIDEMSEADRAEFEARIDAVIEMQGA